jgi:hypothetical protein
VDTEQSLSAIVADALRQFLAKEGAQGRKAKGARP